jgi:hypothetical protein
MRKNVTNSDVKRTVSIKGTMKAAALPLALFLLSAAPLMPRQAQTSSQPAAAGPPTFYRDVLPILQQHCQSCHRLGEIAPMPFVRYEQTRPFADAIAISARDKKMPPWFADPSIGHFSNDPSLTPQESTRSHRGRAPGRPPEISTTPRSREDGPKAGTFRSRTSS